MTSLRRSLAAVLSFVVSTSPIAVLAQPTTPSGPAPSSSSSAAPPATPTPAPTPQPGGPSASALQEASSRFDRGIELYNEGNYTAAQTEFQRAYELTNDWHVIYNIGQVCYQLQDYVCALQNYQQYMFRGADQIQDPRRKEVQDDIAKLKNRVGRIMITTNTPGADVSFDDVPRGKTPLSDSILLSEGRHRLTVTQEGKIPVTQIVDVAGKDDRSIPITLVDAAKSQVIIRDTGYREPPSKFTALSYIGLGVGGALILAGGFFGVQALSKSNDLKKIQFVGDPTPDAQSQQSTVKTDRTLADVFIVGGVLTAGITLLLTLTRNPQAEQPAPATAPAKTGSASPKVDVSLGLTGASLHGEF